MTAQEREAAQCVLMWIADNTLLYDHPKEPFVWLCPQLRPAIPIDREVFKLLLDKGLIEIWFKMKKWGRGNQYRITEAGRALIAPSKPQQGQEADNGTKDQK